MANKIFKSPKLQALLLFDYLIDQSLLRVEAYISGNKSWIEKAVEAIERVPLAPSDGRFEEMTKWSIYDALEPLYSECKWVVESIYKGKNSTLLKKESPEALGKILEGLGVIENITSELKAIFDNFHELNLSQVLIQAHKFNLSSEGYKDSLKKVSGALLAFIKLLSGGDFSKDDLFNYIGRDIKRPGRPIDDDKEQAVKRIRELVAGKKRQFSATQSQTDKWNWLATESKFPYNPQNETPPSKLLREYLRQHHREFYESLNKFLANK